MAAKEAARSRSLLSGVSQAQFGSPQQIVLSPHVTRSGRPFLPGPSVTPAARRNDDSQEQTEVIYDQIATYVNEDYLARLNHENILGLSYEPNQVWTSATIIELRPRAIRKAIEDVMKEVLTIRFTEKQTWTAQEVTGLVTSITDSVRDTCMNALYAKLRFLHQSQTEHSGRYNTRPTFHKDVELPLPFAIAIQEVGLFETIALPDVKLIVPSYPENTANEGRGNPAYSSLVYKKHCEYLTSVGIPLKTINTQITTGSPWWTYKVVNDNGLLDLVATLPPSLLTGHSAILRALFLRNANSNDDTDQICRLRNLKGRYGTMLREAAIGFNRLTFDALCGMSEESWT